MEERRSYRYRCDVDSGDVRCQYSVEHEDMEEVRTLARQHRLADHRQEDFDEAMWNPLIEMERVQGPI